MSGADLTEGTLLGGRLRHAQPRHGHRTGLEPVLLAASIPARPGQRVLEAGTGSGAALLCLAARIPGLQGLGLERDPAMADIARANIAANALPGLAVETADLTAWDEALPQLRVEIDRLISLTHLLQEAAGEQTEPFRPRLSALDELCERVVASYPQQPIELAVPRLLVRLDQALIERALQNLIDNAIRYGRAPIRLAAQQQRASVVLMVEDSGPGLSSANLLGMPRIPPANDRQQRNRSGVGLSIVERCCQLHSGRLALNRSGLGGLQAELHLPQS